MTDSIGKMPVFLLREQAARRADHLREPLSAYGCTGPLTSRALHLQTERFKIASLERHRVCFFMPHEKITNRVWYNLKIVDRTEASQFITQRCCPGKDRRGELVIFLFFEEAVRFLQHLKQV